MHLKRQEVPKTWSVYRKGTKYLVRPSSDLKSGIPLLIILRDLLKTVQNSKEAKRAIFTKDILVNKKVPRDIKRPVLLFDTISIIPAKENYRLDLSNKGDFELKKISENEVNKKISKVVDKKMLKKKMLQLNLLDGRNFLSKEKCAVNDSVLMNFNDGKIERFLPFKENSKVIVFIGKHSGKRGMVNSIDKKKGIAEIETEDKEKLNVLIKQIMVTE